MIADNYLTATALAGIEESIIYTTISAQAKPPNCEGAKEVSTISPAATKGYFRYDG
jgi:hypothetical protein